MGTSCKTCIHKKVCDLWRKEECQSARSFFDDECELYAEGPHWIPVTERLPENDSGVLAFYDDGIESRIIPATFHPKSGWYDCLFNMPSENISYWMPLPEPPKMDKKESK